MRRLFFIIFCYIFIHLAHAEAPALNQLPTHHRKAGHYLPVPKAPSVKAQAYVLTDAQSGKILAQKDAKARMEPASLTKMMTLYIISEALASGRIRLNDKVAISREAWHTGGSKMFLEIGQKVNVEDLIKGIIIVSGNDASVAMAEHIAGSQEAFVNLMNQEAQRLGLTGTHFANVDGMPDPEHYTTPTDLAIVARALIMHFPDYYQRWYKDKWFSFNHIRQANRNRLLWRTNYVDGIKTGHTQSAGFCLVASGKQHDMRLISVVMGSPTDIARTNASKALLTYGFRFYETHRLYHAGQAIQQARVFMGQKKYIQLGVAEDIYVTTPHGQFNDLKATAAVQSGLKAPLQKSQVLGSMKIQLQGQALGNYPLIALSNNPKGSLLSRISDYFTLGFKHLLHLDKDEVKPA